MYVYFNPFLNIDIFLEERHKQYIKKHKKGVLALAEAEQQAIKYFIALLSPHLSPPFMPSPKHNYNTNISTKSKPSSLILYPKFQ